MCRADVTWKNKKNYDTLWKCLDKVQNERDKFLQNLSAALQKHSQVLVDFLQKHLWHLFVSL